MTETDEEIIQALLDEIWERYNRNGQYSASATNIAEVLESARKRCARAFKDMEGEIPMALAGAWEEGRESGKAGVHPDENPFYKIRTLEDKIREIQDETRDESKGSPEIGEAEA